jgi:cysteine-rich repeat protein
MCGDGYHNTLSEDCDDGNSANDDGCVGACQLAFCGDTFVYAGMEECDDGDMDDIDDCTNACMMAVCGDGIVWTDGNGEEECDDANMSDDDACTAMCTASFCGDGVLWQGMETCDDGNLVDTDACPTSCEPAFCGDGFIQQGVEQCDDGNQNNSDGCDTQCIASANPQCFAPYNTLSAADRNISSMSVNRFCDNVNANGWLGPGWYRFSGAAGTHLSEAPPPIQRCSTHAPGWLNGAHPNIGQGIVARQVCFNWGGNQCQWNANIQVVACPGYYLYNLPNAPVCSLRYCGEN